MAPPPQLEGEVLSLWRRDKEKNSEHDKAKELCYGIFHRERVTSGTAVTLATAGMVDSHEYHRTEGNLEEIKKSGGTPDANVGERAFLVQSLPQIEQLCKDYPDFKEGMSQPCAWGENATVSTLACTNVCVGDVFHVFGPDGTKRALELEVASPRRPCSNVDQRHGKRYNQSGVRAHTARTGLGGWFYRILQEGQVAEGDTLRCAQRVAVPLFACGGCRVHRRLCLSTCADRLSGSMPCLPADRSQIGVAPASRVAAFTRRAPRLQRGRQRLLRYSTLARWVSITQTSSSSTYTQPRRSHASHTATRCRLPSPRA